MHTHRILQAMLLLSVVLSTGVAAQTETIILPQGGEQGEAFGMRMDVWGDWLIVGAPTNTAYGNSSGKAYIFKDQAGQWVEQAELFGHDLQAWDLFGRFVAIGPNIALVSASGLQRDSSNAGAVYVFDKIGDDWLLHSKLTAPGMQPGAYYGHCTAFSDGLLFVGAYGTDRWRGVVYVYERSGSSWLLKQTLQPDESERQDYFGRALSVTGQYLAVGARGDDDAGNGAGAVYLYKDSGGTWLEEEKLLPSEPVERLNFGRAVDLHYFDSGQLRLAVSSDYPAQGEQAGKVYVYREAGDFVLEETLNSMPGQGMDCFGYDIALGNNYLAVGAEQSSAWHEFQGAAYLFRQAGYSWYDCGTFYDRAPSSFGLFGVSVAMNPDYLFVGKHNAQQGRSTGLVMAYRLNAAPIITQCVDVPHDQGGAVQLRWEAPFLDIGQKIEKYSLWRALPGGAVAKVSKQRMRTTVVNGRMFDWGWVADMPAHQHASYMAAVPTLYDSISTTSGLHFFMVSAHHPDGVTFIDSAPDSAWSVDNLAPPPPNGVAGAFIDNQVRLSWLPANAPDVAGYRIYRNGEPVCLSAVPGWTDEAPGDAASAGYAVSAVDVHENEGVPGPEVEVLLTAVDEISSAHPQRLALLPNYPNPFNGSTVCRVEVPRRQRIACQIYDMRGRLVAVLHKGVLAAGVHRFRFVPERLPSGIYTCSLVGEGLVQRQKMLYLK